ncbi:hypothetical protein AX16_004779 [Volvariella volvacea WC 439]|nr:hypothetical protein AX16_004779 [Volvariella volvacea WC 439]
MLSQFARRTQTPSKAFINAVRLSSTNAAQRKPTLPSLSLQGKVCMVTGAARGLGKEFCHAFVQSGCTSLAILDLKKEEAEAAAHEVAAIAREHNDNAEDVKIIGLECDISSEQSVKDAYAEILSNFGRIDSVVASAGIVENFTALDYPADRVKKLYDVNVHGAFYTAREAARYMIPQKGGSIVLVASMSGSIVNIPQPQAPYNASKAAVKHMAASLAVEWAKAGVRVNVLSPGYMLTKLTKTVLSNDTALKETWERLTPMGRMGEPEDLAGAIVFLASDASKFMTGAEKQVVFDFTKRKRWADLVITDVSDAIILVLSPSAKVLYCGIAVTELLGWREIDLVDSDLLAFVNSKDHSSFRKHYDLSILTGSELSIYLRLQCKNVFNDDGSRKDVLFEFQGYPHYVLEEQISGCICFFAMAKPYMSRSTNSINAYLDLKTENEKLQQRIVALRSQVNRRAATSSLGSSVVGDTRVPQNLAPLSRDPGFSTSQYSHQVQVPRLSDDPQPKVSRTLYDVGTYANTSLPTTAVAGTTHVDEEAPDEPSRRKKPKKSHTGEHHVCITCGRTDSPEWRKTASPTVHTPFSMAPEVFTLAQSPITSHAFSPDRSQVAVSLNTNNVQIFQRQGSEWAPKETLSEHDKLITSIDWAPVSNRIVTASQDRNAYVWQETPDPETGKLVWKPTLVLLRINRSATYVRWSPKEDKFAVASGARAIAICSFDPENNWWVSKLLKKPIRSTVLSVDWHPNNVLLAAGSADMKARVLSAYIKEVDERPAPTVWGSKLPFNTICGEYASPAGGWVHTVGFSPSGDVLAFASHDSSLSLVYPGGPVVLNIRTPSLPFVTLTWTTENSLVAAGHDCQPIVFSGSESGWQIIGSLDDASGASRSGFAPSPVGRLKTGAFATFRDADTRGQSSAGSSSVSTDTKLLTVHQNTITSVRPYEGYAGQVTKVSTTGVDGNLVVWNVNEVTSNGVAALTGRLSSAHLR